MKQAWEYKLIKIADRVLQLFVDIAFILVLLIGLWFLADTIYVYNNSRAEVTMPYKPTDDDISALEQISEDAIAWITIDNTSIDYPVMQGEDNYEYLNKDPYGSYSLSGSIYLDSRNASDFSDDYSLLYGHHMSGGYMFGALDDFSEEDYFSSHRTGTLFTSRGKIDLKVLAFMYTDVSNGLVFEFEGDQKTLTEWIRENAIHYNPKAEGGKIVALSTCKSPTSTRRMIVFVTMDES